MWSRALKLRAFQVFSRVPAIGLGSMKLPGRILGMIGLAVLINLPAHGWSESKKLSLAECVSIAVGTSGQIAEAKGKVEEWQGRLAEIQAIFYPKITAIAFAAPIFGVTGSVRDVDTRRDYGNWGPYLRFEGMLAQPIYTFGQAAAGEKALQERVKMEEARLEQTRNAVALEVARYYYLHLFVTSIKPTLDSTRKLLDEVIAKAQEMYDSSSGKVTQVDLQKLKFASSELEKYRVQAEIGLALSMAALKHTMGKPESDPLELSDTVLPSAPAGELTPLPQLIQRAWEARPEVGQLRHGREAAVSLRQAEKLAVWPVLALVGQFVAAWTPNRTDQKNTFAYDPYNDVSGGIALALKFDIDPAKASARADSASGLISQADGLAKFAATGIPLEVRKARDDLDQAKRMLTYSEQGASAGKKWMAFAATAYMSGTGETKDVLEGVAAFVSAKKNYYENLLAVHMAGAQLQMATGDIVRVLAKEGGQH